MSNESKKPEHEIRVGRVKAAIWKQIPDDPGKKPFYNVTFARLYKNDQNEWRDASGFYPTDLLTLAKLADLAHTHICGVEETDSKS